MEVENKQVEQPKRKVKIPVKVIGLVAVLVIVAVVAVVLMLSAGKEDEPEIVTVSTLQQIINVSELSTFTAVYNGIAEVMDEKKPENVDYYVSYNASVDAGIDFDKVVISLDEETKTFIVIMPAVYITDVEVKMESLDFLFYDEKANTSTVTEEAYKACIADVTAESEKESAIHELAEKNAVNVLTALLKPFIEQMGKEYSLVIE